MTKRILITAGDPCGIGPEIILRALERARLRSFLADAVIIGDLRVFERAAARLGVRLPRWSVQPSCEQSLKEGSFIFLDSASKARFEPGLSGPHAGRASLGYLATAVKLLKRGDAGALVTAPVSKWAIERVHPGFSGHTEYLASAFGARDVVMLFASQKLRVVLLTRHMALRDVSRALTRRLLKVTLNITLEGLKRQFGIAKPKLVVCGLNPHAGEDGLFGNEEKRVIAPVLKQFRSRGWAVEGPVASDGLFAQPIRVDAIVCAYHDQALIPFKMAARDSGCQVTLGLPFVRTSPDHGSALDIAGKAKAHPGAMRYALRLAAQLRASSR